MHEGTASAAPSSRVWYGSVMARLIESSLPSLHAEQAFWRAGLPRVAGVDEVGRGALAGPLVAAAVILPCCHGARLGRLRAALGDVRDSKLILPTLRESLAAIIYETAQSVAVGVVDVAELDAIGLGAANRLAMERAVAGLTIAAEVLLLDALVLDLDLPQVGLIKGDTRSLSIGAASIVAKVTRDRFMTDCDADDGRYAFATHKGYGTAAHLLALDRYGPGPLHRRCFAPVARRERRS